MAESSIMSPVRLGEFTGFHLLFGDPGKKRLSMPESDNFER
jgi:hypothetical protein